MISAFLAANAVSDPSHELARRQLPALLQFFDGAPVVAAAQWPARREEIVALLTDQVFGRAPQIAPENVHFALTRRNANALGGAATLKQVAVTLGGPRGELTFELVLFTPNGRPQPAPVFLLACHRGPQNLDPSRAQKTEFWPVEDLIARGFGAAAFLTGTLDPDEDDNFQNGVHGAFDPTLQTGLKRADDAWGTIAAWAWGASRAMDYLQTDGDVDKTKVAIIGHSRGGKTALWAGATDPRFALVVSNCSGQTGAALGRGKTGETLAQINQKFPHWFATNYQKYNHQPDARFFDQHWLLAAIAPRLLYVVSAQDDSWADPRSEFLGALAASGAWELNGEIGLRPQEWPQTDQPMQTGKIGYHRRAGGHGLTAWDWARVMDFAHNQWL